MIVYDICCANDHRFEAWFKNADAFDAQAAQGAVACPDCGTTEVRKAPMAPAVSTRRAGPPVAVVEAMRALRSIQEHVEKTFEPVGTRFADEARKIHLGETEARGIYGSTTPEEAKALKDEGVPFASLPWLPKRDS